MTKKKNIHVCVSDAGPSRRRRNSSTRHPDQSPVGVGLRRGHYDCETKRHRMQYIRPVSDQSQGSFGFVLTADTDTYHTQSDRLCRTNVIDILFPFIVCSSCSLQNLLDIFGTLSTSQHELMQLNLQGKKVLQWNIVGLVHQ